MLMIYYFLQLASAISTPSSAYLSNHRCGAHRFSRSQTIFDHRSQVRVKVTKAANQIAITPFHDSVTFVITTNPIAQYIAVVLL